MEAKSPAVRIDYVKYIIDMDVDRMQQFSARFNAQESADEIGVRYGRDLKLSVLPGGSGGRMGRRLVLESWGENCAKLIDHLDSGKAEYITRLDYRRELPAVERKHIEAYVARTAIQGKGRRNVQTFNSRPRQKTDTRDIGGFGVFIGSRKSDACTTAYQRGNETPAVEHRFQGHRAADIANDGIARAFDDDGTRKLSEHIMAALEYAARIELNKSTGQKSWEALVDDMHGAKLWADKMHDAAEWAEQPEEQAFWNALSDDEKMADLKGQWVPTSVFTHHARAAGIRQTGVDDVEIVPIDIARAPKTFEQLSPEEKAAADIYDDPEMDGF